MNSEAIDVHNVIGRSFAKIPNGDVGCRRAIPFRDIQNPGSISKYIGAQFSLGGIFSAADQRVCSEPKSPCGNGQNDGEYGNDGFAIIVNGFADMPERDKRYVILGAIFIGTVAVAGFVAYLAIHRK